MPKLIGELINPHLTDGDQRVEPRLRQTYAGMAHFAGSGPEGKTCRECKRWSEDRNVERYVDGWLKPAKCGKFVALMGNDPPAPTVPYEAKSCVFFEEDISIPPVWHDPRSTRTSQDL